MAEKDKKYFWLKLKRDFFKRHDIRIIESMPNGKDYILFYLKLLCESVDHEGNLRFSESIPYNDEMLATITNTNVDIVRSAVKVFTELGMMEVMDDGTFYMTEVNKMIGSETYWAERKRIQKARKDEEFKNITMLSHEQFTLPNGETHFIDEKRYGGNGMKVWDRAKGKCEICGSTENLCIHHNNGYSNEMSDLILVCRACHRKIETGELENFQLLSNASPTCPSKSKSQNKSKSKTQIQSKNDDLSIINRLTGEEKTVLEELCDSHDNFVQLIRYADAKISTRTDNNDISDPYSYLLAVGINDGFIEENY